MAKLQTETQLLDWAVGSRAFPGQTSTGDRALVKAFPKGTLVAVVDALGHGPEAVPAAERAVALLERYAHEPLPSILQRCHTELIGSRGVVMSLASFKPSDHTMSWLGVGNVEGVLVSADPRSRPQTTLLLTRGGIVGGDLPKASPWVVPLSRGDTLLFSTDGVRPGFASTVTLAESPQEIADRVIAGYAKETDDALVLVVRYLGDR